MSKVYFLPWERIEEFPAWVQGTGLAATVKERDFVALKIHFGEQGNKGYIPPRLVRPVVELLKNVKANPFLTDASTIYVGTRADAVHHLLTANDHGFTVDNCGCPVIIADGLRGNADVDVPVNGKHFSSVSIANAIHYADSLVFLSHFKGHEISGFGGALKNIGMGCATRKGKYAMHDQVHPQVNTASCIACGKCVAWCPSGALTLPGEHISFSADLCIGCGECILSCPNNVFSIPWDEHTSSVQEKIVEYAGGVLAVKPHFSVNFLFHITKYCDCYPTREGPLLKDIGVLASGDPVALDQASADMVNRQFGSDLFRHLFPHIDWELQLAYAEKLGLGSRKYEIVHNT
jgi:uncharacterized Fe-S center protein